MWDALKLTLLAIAVSMCRAHSAPGGLFVSSSRGLLRSLEHVSDDLPLFGDDEPSEPAPLVRPETPIAEWQVELLRRALDARSLTDMSDRRQQIEDLAGRPVASLRELTADEAMTVLAALGRTPPAARPSGSSWDDRDEDTWIDRL